MAKASFAVCPFFAVCFSVADGKELLCRLLADGKELADGKVADSSSAWYMLPEKCMKKIKYLVGKIQSFTCIFSVYLKGE